MSPSRGNGTHDSSRGNSSGRRPPSAMAVAQTLALASPSAPPNPRAARASSRATSGSGGVTKANSGPGGRSRQAVPRASASGCSGAPQSAGNTDGSRSAQGDGGASEGPKSMGGGSASARRFGVPKCGQCGSCRNPHWKKACFTSAPADSTKRKQGKAAASSNGGASGGSLGREAKSGEMVDRHSPRPGRSRSQSQEQGSGSIAQKHRQAGARPVKRRRSREGGQLLRSQAQPARRSRSRSRTRSVSPSDSSAARDGSGNDAPCDNAASDDGKDGGGSGKDGKGQAEQQRTRRRRVSYHGMDDGSDGGASGSDFEEEVLKERRRSRPSGVSTSGSGSGSDAAPGSGRGRANVSSGGEGRGGSAGSRGRSRSRSRGASPAIRLQPPAVAGDDGALGRRRSAKVPPEPAAASTHVPHAAAAAAAASEAVGNATLTDTSQLLVPLRSEEITQLLGGTRIADATPDQLVGVAELIGLLGLDNGQGGQALAPSAAAPLPGAPALPKAGQQGVAKGTAVLSGRTEQQVVEALVALGVTWQEAQQAAEAAAARAQAVPTPGLEAWGDGQGGQVAATLSRRRHLRHKSAHHKGRKGQKRSFSAHGWIKKRKLQKRQKLVLPQLLAGSIVAAKVLQARILGRPHPKPSCKRKACKAGDPTAAEGFEAEDEALEQERSSQGRQQRRRTAISWRASLPAQLFEPCCDERLPLGAAGSFASAAQRIDRAVLALRGSRGAVLNSRQLSLNQRSITAGDAGLGTGVRGTDVLPAAERPTADLLVAIPWGDERLTGDALLRLLSWLRHGSLPLPSQLDRSLTGASTPFGCGRCLVCTNPRAMHLPCLRRPSSRFVRARVQLPAPLEPAHASAQVPLSNPATAGAPACDPRAASPSRRAALASGYGRGGAGVGRSSRLAAEVRLTSQHMARLQAISIGRPQILGGRSSQAAPAPSTSGHDVGHAGSLPQALQALSAARAVQHAAGPHASGSSLRMQLPGSSYTGWQPHARPACVWCRSVSHSRSECPLWLLCTAPEHTALPPQAPGLNVDDIGAAIQQQQQKAGRSRVPRQGVPGHKSYRQPARKVKAVQCEAEAEESLACALPDWLVRLDPALQQTMERLQEAVGWSQPLQSRSPRRRLEDEPDDLDDSLGGQQVDGAGDVHLAPLAVPPCEQLPPVVAGKAEMATPEMLLVLAVLAQESAALEAEAAGQGEPGTQGAEAT